VTYRVVFRRAAAAEYADACLGPEVSRRIEIVGVAVDQYSVDARAVHAVRIMDQVAAGGRLMPERVIRPYVGSRLTIAAS